MPASSWSVGALSRMAFSRAAAVLATRMAPIEAALPLRLWAARSASGSWPSVSIWRSVAASSRWERANTPRMRR